MECADVAGPFTEGILEVIGSGQVYMTVDKRDVRGRR
jgi:hypothetical protein